MTDVARAEQVRFAVWVCLVAAIAGISSVTMIRWAEHDQAVPTDDATARRWLIQWAIVSGVVLLAAAALGGLAVFTARAAWDVVLTWPFLVGPVVGAVAFVTFGAMGQFEPGSASCGIDEGDCNISLGFGAGLLSLITALALGSTFLVSHLCRRALSWAWSHGRMR